MEFSQVQLAYARLNDALLMIERQSIKINRMKAEIEILRRLVRSPQLMGTKRLISRTSIAIESEAMH